MTSVAGWIAVFSLVRTLISSRAGICTTRTFCSTSRSSPDHGTIGWHLVREDSVPDSVGLSWSSQRRCLGINNKVPRARVLIYTIVGYYLSTGVRLFTPLPHVRCSDRLSFGHGIVVSNWMERDLIGVASGIGCSNYSRSFSDERLGVVSERKR